MKHGFKSKAFRNPKKIQKNTLWYMGFLSVLSLLYFIEGKTAFLWFLSFIPYFATYKISDERLETNLGKAARNAFVFTIFFGIAAIVYIYLKQNTELFAPAFVILLGGNLITCLLSLFYYDKRDIK
ncbi:MAG: DUF3796 domain-containing protein [Nanoarchaeota archaeon]